MSYKAVNLYKALNIRKAPNIYKILLPLDDHNRTYKVSKARKDKASRPALNIKEATILLSISVKTLRILFSKDLYIYLIKKD